MRGSAAPGPPGSLVLKHLLFGWSPARARPSCPFALGSRVGVRSALVSAQGPERPGLVLYKPGQSNDAAWRVVGCRSLPDESSRTKPAAQLLAPPRGPRGPWGAHAPQAVGGSRSALFSQRWGPFSQ